MRWVVLNVTSAPDWAQHGLLSGTNSLTFYGEVDLATPERNKIKMMPPFSHNGL